MNVNMPLKVVRNKVMVSLQNSVIIPLGKSMNRKKFTLDKMYICHYVQRDLPKWEKKIIWKLKHHRKFTKNDSLNIEEMNEWYIDCNDVEDKCMIPYVEKINQYRENKIN